VRLVRVPGAAAFVSAVLAYALRPPFSIQLADGIVTATVALIAYLALNLAFNRTDLVNLVRRLRSFV
jgi:hypothetical protein